MSQVEIACALDMICCACVFFIQSTVAESQDILNWGDSHPPTDVQLADAIQRCGVRSDRSFSLLDMRDPDAATHHCGLAAEVILRLWRHHRPQMEMILRTIRADLLNWYSAAAGRGTPGRRVTYILWCRSGKHRSVATSRVVANVLKMLGVQVAFAVVGTHVRVRVWVWVLCVRVSHVARKPG